MFAQSAWEVACYPQLELKKAEMDRLLAANPKEPVGLLNRGELLLDDGKLKPAIADFLEAERNNLPEDRSGQLQKKYVAYTELLRPILPRESATWTNTSGSASCRRSRARVRRTRSGGRMR